MTPSSKGARGKRASGSRSSAATSSRAGKKKASGKVAATARKRPSLPKKKAAPVVKKAATTTKKTAPAAKKTAPPARKAPPAGARKAATAKKAAPAAKKTVPAAKKTAPPAKKIAPTVAKKAVTSKKGTASGNGSAAARTAFAPKPKPKRPAPVRPKTGPSAKAAKFLEEVRELLEAERAIYQEQATSLRAEADSLALEREPGDVQFDEESGEGGTVTVDRERNLALSGQAVLAVEEIDLAMERVADKTYGYCERCFQPIPKPRLRALPYARLCVACKSGGLSRR